MSSDNSSRLSNLRQGKAQLRPLQSHRFNVSTKKQWLLIRPPHSSVSPHNPPSSLSNPQTRLPLLRKYTTLHTLLKAALKLRKKSKTPLPPTFPLTVKGLNPFFRKCVYALSQIFNLSTTPTGVNSAPSSPSSPSIIKFYTTSKTRLPKFDLLEIKVLEIKKEIEVRNSGDYEDVGLEGNGNDDVKIR